MLGNERGVIQNKERASQLVDFRGLLFGSITPTDIDGFLEYKNKAFILFELKYRGNEMQFGQRLAFERLAASLKKDAIVFLAIHHTPVNMVIDAAECMVSSYYWNGWRRGWTPPDRSITLKHAMQLYVDFIERKYRKREGVMRRRVHNENMRLLSYEQIALPFPPL